MWSNPAARLKNKQTAKKGNENASEKENSEEIGEDARLEAIERRQGRRPPPNPGCQKQAPVPVALRDSNLKPPVGLFRQAVFICTNLSVYLKNSIRSISSPRQRDDFLPAPKPSAEYGDDPGAIEEIANFPADRPIAKSGSARSARPMHSSR